MPLFLIYQRSSPLYSGSSSTEKIGNWFSILKLIFIKKCMPYQNLNTWRRDAKFTELTIFAMPFQEFFKLKSSAIFVFFSKLPSLYNVNCNECLNFYYNTGIYTEKIFHFSYLNLYSQVFFSGRFSKFSVRRRKSKIGSSLQKRFLLAVK